VLGGAAMDHGVSPRYPRNSRTASWNRWAPSAAISPTPPARSTHVTNRTAASRRSSMADRCRCVIPGNPAAPSHRYISTDTALQRWSIALCGASLGARWARCRYSRSRSSSRVPSPRIHRLMVHGATPALRAALVTVASSESASATAATMTSTPVTLPGSASQGSTRSRCPHPRQRASATGSVTNASSVSNRRSTRLRVIWRSLPSQRAQRQSARSSSPAGSTTAE
jgi:hypothetical protein